MAKVYAAHDLTGGGAGALDAIDGSDLLNDDIALVLHDSYGLMTYLLDVDSSQAESSPEIIKPDYNAGPKRWILQDILGSSSLIPSSVTNFTATLTGQFIELTWDKGTCSAYRLDLNSTTILDNYTGTRYVYRGNLMAGNYQFTIYGLNYLGNPSASGVSQTITISVPSTPNPSSTLYEEMITLSWADCKTSLPISHYLINTVNCGPSLEFRERVTWTGTKAYSMYAVDVAGNTSEEGTLDEIVASINTPTNIVTTGKTYAIALAITVPSIPTDGAIEVWGSAINNRTGALLLGESFDKTFTHIGLAFTATYYYWVRCRDAYYSVGSWYPSSATAGVSGSTSTSPTDYLTILQGSLTESQLYTDLNDRIDLIDTSAFIVDDGVVGDEILLGLEGIYGGLSAVQALHATGISAAAAAAAAAQSTANTAVSNASTAEQAAAAAQITANLKINTFFATTAPTALQAGDLWFNTSAGNAPYRASAPGSGNWVSIKDSDIVTALANAAAAQTTANGKNVTFYTNSAPIAHAAGDLWFDTDDGNKVYRSTAAGSGSWVAVRDAAISTTVATLQALSAEVAGLTTSEWSATGDYILGKYVVYDGEVYRCLIAYTYDIDGTKTPGTDTDYWEAADSLATLVNQIETEMDELAGEVSTKVSNATYDLLEGRVDLAESAITQNAGAITLKAEQSSLDDVDGRLLLAEASIVTHGDEIALKVSKEDFDILGGKVATAESTLITHANEIEARVTTATFGGLETRVSTAESTITQHSDAIVLKVAKTDFDNFANLFVPLFSNSAEYALGEYTRYGNTIYVCIKVIDFSPAPTPTITAGWETYWEATNFSEGFAQTVNQVAINTDNISITSGAIVGAIALVPDVVVAGTVVEDIGDVENVDLRLTQAGIDINGAKATILLHTQDISLLTGRVSQAEIDINAAEAAITLKASQSSLDATDASLTTLTGRVSTAEVDIAAGEAGTWSSISSKATTATVDAIDSRLSIAESDITAGEAGTWSSISSKATTATVSAIDVRLTEAESDISAGEAGTWASISNKATTATVSALDSRVSGAESNISAGIAGSWSSISSKAATSVVSALDTRVGAAEIAITNGQAGTWSSISEKLQVVTYTNDQKDANAYLRVTALENRMLVYDTTDTTTWDSGTTYNPGHIIKWDSHYYKCIKTSTNHIPPNVTYWTEITAGMVTEWTLKMNANGRVAGVGLMMDSDSSEFIILADKFQVVTPSDTGDPVQVFTVGNIAGNPAVGIDGDLIIDGSILARSIATGQLVVGDNVTMGASAYIAWDHVTSQPTIPTNTNQLTDGAGLGTTATWTSVSGRPNTTYIDGSGIYTGTLAASQVNAVAINASSISTGTLAAARMDATYIYSGTLTASQVNSVAINASSITTGTLDTARLAFTPATNTNQLTDGAGLGTTALWSGVTGTGKPSDNADVTLTAINGGLSVTGGGLTLSGGGSIKGGQTDYNTGTGFFLGYSGSTYKFSIGNTSTNSLTWNGSTLAIRGSITADDISAGTLSVSRLNLASWIGKESTPSLIAAQSTNFRLTISPTNSLIVITGMVLGTYQTKIRCTIYAIDNASSPLADGVYLYIYNITTGVNVVHAYYTSITKGSTAEYNYVGTSGNSYRVTYAMASGSWADVTATVFVESISTNVAV